MLVFPVEFVFVDYLNVTWKTEWNKAWQKMEENVMDTLRKMLDRTWGEDGRTKQGEKMSHLHKIKDVDLYVQMPCLGLLRKKLSSSAAPVHHHSAVPPDPDKQFLEI